MAGVASVGNVERVPTVIGACSCHAQSILLLLLPLLLLLKAAVVQLVLLGEGDWIRQLVLAGGQWTRVNYWVPFLLTKYFSLFLKFLAGTVNNFLIKY